MEAKIYHCQNTPLCARMNMSWPRWRKDSPTSMAWKIMSTKLENCYSVCIWLFKSDMQKMLSKSVCKGKKSDTE